MIRSALYLLMLTFVVSCSDDEEIVVTPDSTPPGDVTDLEATAVDTASVSLEWTASGDDGAEGTADGYVVRWSLASISESNWNQAQILGSAPAPGPPGASESMLVGDLDPDTEYFFALKVTDEAGNLSGLSNGVSARTHDPPPVSAYRPQTSPESVVHNLQTAYRERNIGEYARLLAPEFAFMFQPPDAERLGTDFWTRDPDSVGTGNLFSTSVVVSISIALTHGPAQPVGEVGFPAGAMKIRITGTQLEVQQADGTSFLVEDMQDMFFRAGNVSLGEDPSEWFLIEWRDIPSQAAASAPWSGGLVTWGGIKSRY